MNQNYILLLVMLNYFSLLFSQAPQVEWVTILGGNSVDFAEYVVELENAYLILGNTNSFGSYDVYLVKLNPYGDTMWTKTIDYGEEDRGECIIKTTDNNFSIVGYTNSYGNGEYDVLLIKTDTSGNVLWYKTFGGTSSDYGMYVKETNDKGYIVAGYTKSFSAQDFDIYIIRTDSMGELLWQKNIDIEGDDKAYGIEKVSDSVYIIIGNTLSGIFLVKIRDDGKIIWTKIIRDSIWDLKGYSVSKTNDRGFVIAGKRQQLYLLKIDSTGEHKWSWEYLFLMGVGIGVTAFQATDGKYVVLGNRFYFGIVQRIYSMHLFKIDSTGYVWWQVVFGDALIWRVASLSIQTRDGGYLVVGGTGMANLTYPSWDLFIAKLSNEVSVKENIYFYSPATDIHYKLGKINDSYLFDLSGRMLAEGPLTGITRKVPKGIYFIVSKERNETKKLKLLKIR